MRNQTHTQTGAETMTRTFELNNKAYRTDAETLERSPRRDPLLRGRRKQGCQRGFRRHAPGPARRKDRRSYRLSQSRSGRLDRPADCRAQGGEPCARNAARRRPRRSGRRIDLGTFDADTTITNIRPVKTEKKGSSGLRFGNGGHTWKAGPKWNHCLPVEAGLLTWFKRKARFFRMSAYAARWMAASD